MPHTVELDQGNIWYTGNSNGTVGKLDPQTGKITEYKMPDPQAKDPHTAVFDRQGTCGSRFSRATWWAVSIRRQARSSWYHDDARCKAVRHQGDASGSLWVACNGSNCLVKVDPETMAITEVKLPLAGTTVRRLDIAGDGMIWYVNSAMGRLGRFDPKTGQIKEWASPSGPKSHPYAIAVVDGIVWYNESGQRPDALVRFDPKTETFQSWPIPSGSIYAGILRHMRPARDGNLLIHQTSTNRIIQVTVQGRTASR